MVKTSCILPPIPLDHVVEVLLGYSALDALSLEEETVRVVRTRNEGSRFSFEQIPCVLD